MRRLAATLVLLAAGCGSDGSPPTVTTASYNIDAGRISISGLSSGAYMAGQVHVSHAALISGVGLVAGGPYYCAAGDVARGLGICMQGGDIPVDSLLTSLQAAAARGVIDDPSYLDGDRVWLFHGTLDSTVSLGPSEAAAEFYRKLTDAEHIAVVTDVDAVHGLPALAAELPCDTLGAPFLNDCDYDAAGAMLQWLHGDLEPRTIAGDHLLTVPQPGFEQASMLEHALLYVPASCAAGAACGMHIALHGCLQSSEFVEQAFAQQAGYNEWAEANDLLVLYPQVASSKVAPMNPYGCWDWWGYTGADYATKNGAQIAVIKATFDRLAGLTP